MSTIISLSLAGLTVLIDCSDKDHGYDQLLSNFFQKIKKSLNEESLFHLLNFYLFCVL